MTRPALLCLLPGLLLAATAVRAVDGPTDNQSARVRPVPKPGIDVPEADRAELEAGLKGLAERIDRLRAEAAKSPRHAALLPDVEVFHKAVHDALTYREFFDGKELDKARLILKEGTARAEALLAGQAPWTSQTGLVVRGYRSKIDGSVQPYGLVVPESYTAAGKARYRVDLWFHGRGETLSEVNFVHERMTQPGQFRPADTFVLHPYGRYCNAFKLAGEVDVYEALDAARAAYRIDDDRVSVRGFSMGGAAAWHLAVHDPARWFAANPGAGFSETPRFLDVFQNETLSPPWYEKALWSLYDCDQWAGNLRLVPTVAYSGSKDKQKQAADVMAEALARFGIELTHVIGPDTAHQYHPDSAREVEARLNALAEVGRVRVPRTLTFTTYTLRYNRAAWVTVDALGEHWKAANVTATFDGSATLSVRTENVRALTLEFPPGRAPFDAPDDAAGVVVRHVAIPLAIDGQELEGPSHQSDRSWKCQLHREGTQWKLGPLPADGPRKQHGLQGPIDDAFLDSFLIVTPTGTAANPKVGAWVQAEQTRAITEWRRHFRGTPRVKADTEVTDADIAGSNLVLWGDPASNAVLKRIADKLAIRWAADAIRVGEASYPAADHAAILVAPNPLNPARYVVLNSGFTFREYDYLNNARQTPKLPDWAIIDLNTPPDARWPGKVVAADFFDESWRLRPAAGAAPAGR